MSLLPAVANSWVLPAAVPYLAIASYDFWLHETDRQVPRSESVLHFAIAVSVAAFLVLAALGLNRAAAVALAVLLIAALIDELRYHGELPAHEKRLHYLGGAGLAFCVSVWIWTI